MQVDGREQSVVVEHLLEVGDEPLVVHRVAVEATPDQVVHPARGHPVERPGHHVQLVPPEQELERRRGREFRSAAEAAPLRVELRAQPADGAGEQRRLERLARRLQLARAAYVLHQLTRRTGDVGTAVAVGRGDGLEHLAEARQPMARLRRVVRAAEEGLAVGGEEDRHRPAAVAGQGDDRVHVDRVEVGPFLAVDLDVDEELVHELRRRLVLERLVLHDVAPVAGRVADREQDRPVLARAPARAPPRPTGTSRPGCPRAEGGTGSSRSRGGSCPQSSHCRPRTSGRGRGRGRRRRLGSCILGLVRREELLLALLLREEESDHGGTDQDRDDSRQVGPVVAV